MRFTLREPLLHFALLGTLLFLAKPALSFWLPFGQDRRITISQAEIDQFTADWRTQAGRVPTDKERQALLRRHIDREILFREALRRDLHRHDSVVRQRLLRNMKFLEPDTDAPDQELLEIALNLGMASEDLVARSRLIQRMQHDIESRIQVSDNDLRNYYQRHTEKLAPPARYDLRHLFFSNDRPASSTARNMTRNTANVRAQNALDALHNNPAAKAEIDSDPFLHGERFNQLSQQRIRQYFGDDIADALPGLPHNQWSDPLSSAYGYHLIQVQRTTPGKTIAFDDVRNRLVADVYREKEHAALSEWLASHRDDYEIVVEKAQP